MMSSIVIQLKYCKYGVPIVDETQSSDSHIVFYI